MAAAVAGIRADGSPQTSREPHVVHHAPSAPPSIRAPPRHTLEDMPTTLQDPRVASTLDRMYAESKKQMSMLRDRISDFDRPMSTQERTEAMSEFYIPVTPEAGRLLYALVRATRPTTVVEFGMSFGISALHLAAAVRDNGDGRVVTTELSATKIAAAKQTFAATGLDDVITILEGDALATLADLEGPVDFVLLDGWKDLYLPVIELLEPRLSTGALVVADNTGAPDTQPYLDRVRNPDNGYVGFNFAVRESDSMELSCRTND
jgi:predicted O-methyltransferase YrrM